MVIMETVKRLMGDEFQSLKQEIQVHFGHPSGYPQKEAQVVESQVEHKPEPSAPMTKNHIENHHEDEIQIDHGLQHADLSSVPAKEVRVKENLSQSTNEIVTTTATAEKTPTVKETDTTYDDSDEEGKVQLQVQVQVEERAVQILSRGVMSPVVPKKSPGQHN